MFCKNVLLTNSKNIIFVRKDWILERILEVAMCPTDKPSMVLLYIVCRDGFKDLGVIIPLTCLEAVTICWPSDILATHFHRTLEH